MLPLSLTALLLAAGLTAGCGNDAPPTGSPLTGRDSLPVMLTRGVTKLISDSGIIRYKVVAEEWGVYDKTTPPRWEFNKGIFLERFDDKFHANMHITADSAKLFDQNLWKLRGHIVLKDDAAQVVLRTNELYWNMRTGELSSNVFTRLVKPTEEIEGNWFRATAITCGRRRASCLCRTMVRHLQQRKFLLIQPLSTLFPCVRLQPAVPAPDDESLRLVGRAVGVHLG